MSTIDQQFVEFIVKSLVGKPDAVKIDRRIDEKGVLLELTVDPEDLGRVIGKRGATAQSIRSLLRALGTKNDARYNLKIVDNGVEQPNRSYERPEKEEKFEEEPAVTSSISDDIDDEDEDSDLDEELPEKAEPSSVVSKTRKELEELDDLDV